MNHNNSNPTDEMVDFYVRRTNEHISRVRVCLLLLAPQVDFAEELIARSEVHDASKFGDEERIPYIWLTEFHRCRRSGTSFRYPPGMQFQVDEAIAHHMRSNRHHPEFHADPNDMTMVDLTEMVCDWTAMALEFGQEDGSARSWADRTIGSRVHFNKDNEAFVYATIAKLELLLCSRSDS